MVILGIDPGFSFSGYAVISYNKRKAFLLDYGYLSLKPSQYLSQRIGIFFYHFEEKIKYWKVTDISLETPFLGKNAQNFLKLGYLRGAVYLLVDRYQLCMHEFSPREIKQAVTGFGGAQKDQVARIIMQLFPMIEAPTKADVTDALAITLCAAWKM